MELYFDVDGVILDFEASMIDYVRSEYLPDLPADFQLKNWSMDGEFKELDMMKVWNEFIASGRFTELKPLVDIDRFNQLAERHSVALVTNLPDDDYHYKARIENLKNLGITHHGLYLAGHFNFEKDDYPTKSGMIKRLTQEGQTVVFMDDHPKNCEDVMTNISGSHVYMMSAPHNSDEAGFDWARVDNWDEFFELIETLEKS